MAIQLVPQITTVTINKMALFKIGPSVRGGYRCVRLSGLHDLAVFAVLSVLGALAGS
ncbi:hypothetical protein [Pseudooceanicola sp. MF1-13]|uniref:hypothetical protein n=1 Tax=Pseudooceanicola sp. MF1-13 TaxID=3379095 RepID=UPI00389143AA